MKIAAQKNDTALTFVIEGSIDTVTAPELEKELKEQWGDITKLVLDFTAVDYVSSAGLRVIMEADKFMSDAGTMILKNVNEDVMEVFEMTGFDELLTFE